MTDPYAERGDGAEMVDVRLRTVPLDSRGHRHQSPHDPKQGTVVVGDHVFKLPDGSTDVISSQVGHLFQCASCGAFPSLSIDGEKASARTPCPHPDGLVTTFRVPLRSGRVVVSDDLRPVYDGFDGEGFASYNSALGQHQVDLSFAALGCAHGYVGNSCPRLMQTGPSSYVVVSLAYWETEDDDGPIVPKGWTEIAHICTDTWAYCMADFEDFKAKGGPEEPSNADIVDMPPGVYEFTNYTAQAGFDMHADGQLIYASIERVSDADSPTSDPA